MCSVLQIFMSTKKASSFLKLCDGENGVLFLHPLYKEGNFPLSHPIL